MTSEGCRSDTAAGARYAAEWGTSPNRDSVAIAAKGRIRIDGMESAGGLRVRQFVVASMRGAKLCSTALRLIFRLAVTSLPWLPSYSRAWHASLGALFSGPGS